MKYEKKPSPLRIRIQLTEKLYSNDVDKGAKSEGKKIVL